MKRKSLKELKELIEDEIEFVDIKSFSAPLISLRLRQIRQRFGKRVSNKVIIDLHLGELGYKKI